MSSNPLPQDHTDYPAVEPVVRHILAATKGIEQFRTRVTRLFRTAIDEVIDAPRTGRLVLSATEKTEKTYLGTKIEILLRSELGFEKGAILDMSIAGTEVDIKTTMGSTWTIPPENKGRLALLVKTDDAKAICSVGIGLMKNDYLSDGQNRDGKRTIRADSRQHMWWLMRDEPYPPNIWEQIEPNVLNEILEAGAATARMTKLFELIQDRPISRTHVQAIARQHDYMKRLRKNGGARDHLAPKRIALLWGQKDQSVIQQLKLGPVARDEFISHAPRNQDEASLLRNLKHID
jgi:hypothetical protein